MAQIFIYKTENVSFNLYNAKILLYNAGYEAITIENLQGNIEEKMMKQNPHLVLLDINLPEKNGYEICSIK